MEKEELMPISSPPVFGSFEEFLAGQPGISKATAREYLSIVRKFEKKGDALTIDTASSFLAKNRNCPSRAALLYMAKWKKDRALVMDIKDLRVKQKKKMPHELPSLEEMMKVIEALPPEEKHISLFLLNTGARCQEAMKLKLGGISEDGKMLLSAKGETYREVFLPRSFMAELARYLKEEKGILNGEYIFYSGRTGSNYKTQVKRYWSVLNGVSNRVLGHGIQTHDFRRFCAAFLYEKTNDLEYVSKFLGHSDIKTTHIYTRYSQQGRDLREAASILDGLNTTKKKTETEAAAGQ